MPTINELQLAKELIRFPSVPKTDAGVIKFLEKKLKKIGFKTKILEFKDLKNFKDIFKKDCQTLTDCLKLNIVQLIPMENI